MVYKDSNSFELPPVMKLFKTKKNYFLGTFFSDNRISDMSPFPSRNVRVRRRGAVFPQF